MKDTMPGPLELKQSKRKLGKNVKLVFSGMPMGFNYTSLTREIGGALEAYVNAFLPPLPPGLLPVRS